MPATRLAPHATCRAARACPPSVIRLLAGFSLVALAGCSHHATTLSKPIRYLRSCEEIVHAVLVAQPHSLQIDGVESPVDHFTDLSLSGEMLTGTWNATGHGGHRQSFPLEIRFQDIASVRAEVVDTHPLDRGVRVYFKNGNTFRIPVVTAISDARNLELALASLSEDQQD